ncbi:MAG: UDP-glucose 4-epimerase GalE [Paracoccaceae bacterium]
MSNRAHPAAPAPAPVLVTGGAGYVGSHVAHALVDAGERVIVIDDLSTGSPAALPPEADLVEGDVADRALLDAVLAKSKADAILHLAGSTVVPESCRDPLRYYANNTLASHALIAAARHHGVECVLFSSTAAVYGAISTDPVDESAALAPASPYGASKLMTERMLADAAVAHGLSTAALRYFNVAGADPAGRTGQSTPGATHLVKVAVQAALGLRAGLEVFGTDWPTPDGTCIRDYIHVSDLAEAHLAVLAHLRTGRQAALAAGRPPPPARVFNVGYGRGASVRDVIAAVRRVAGKSFPVTDRPRRPGDLPAVVARADRIRRETGWRARRDALDTIVADALAWERRLIAAAGTASLPSKPSSRTTALPRKEAKHAEIG